MTQREQFLLLGTDMRGEQDQWAPLAKRERCDSHRPKGILIDARCRLEAKSALASRRAPRLANDRTTDV